MSDETALAQQLCCVQQLGMLGCKKKPIWFIVESIKTRQTFLWIASAGILALNPKGKIWQQSSASWLLFLFCFTRRSSSPWIAALVHSREHNLDQSFWSIAVVMRSSPKANNHVDCWVHPDSTNLFVGFECRYPCTLPHGRETRQQSPSSWLLFQPFIALSGNPHCHRLVRSRNHYTGRSCRSINQCNRASLLASIAVLRSLSRSKILLFIAIFIAVEHALVQRNSRCVRTCNGPSQPLLQSNFFVREIHRDRPMSSCDPRRSWLARSFQRDVRRNWTEQ